MRIYITALVMMFCNSALAEPDYYSSILKNAKSAAVFFSVFDTEGCRFEHEIEFTRVKIVDFVSKGGALEIVDIPIKGRAPDLGLLVLVESSPAKISHSQNECNFLVKTSAYHSTQGYLRYDPSPKMLRILAYQNILYGSSSKNSLAASADETLNTSLGLFLKQLKDSQAQD